jgi:hypothetical protein
MLKEVVIMRYSLLVPILVVLSFAVSSARADLQLTPVDAVNPPADFAKTFAISIKKQADRRTITISYKSRPEQKTMTMFADGTKAEHYDEGVVEEAEIIFADENGRDILTAPLQFSKGPAGRTSASINLQENLAKRTSVRLFIPVHIDGFCYEIHFRNVK